MQQRIRGAVSLNSHVSNELIAFASLSLRGCKLLKWLDLEPFGLEAGLATPYCSLFRPGLDALEVGVHASQKASSNYDVGL